MRKSKKLFYRIFQKSMHLMIPFFPYREPKLLNEIEEILEVLDKKKIDNLLIVTGKKIRARGLTLPLEEMLANNNIKFSIFDDTLQNPTTDNVEAAREVYLNNCCNGIIAFGGGSVMDCAKALGARIVRPKKSLEQMAGLIKVRRRLPLLIAVPTTAGTGSETTVASVIVDSKTHHKYVINAFCLIPKYAVMNPSVTVSLPKYITAITGMDALTHAVEAYIGRSKTRKSKKAAITAVKMIFENLEKAYEDGTNLDIRRNMLEASYLAGTAFTKSYVGYVHALAHPLGGKYGVDHGLANAVLLPHVLRAYGSSVTKSLAKLAKTIGLVEESLDNETAKEIFISHIEQMNKSMDIPDRLDYIKIEDISEMSKHAYKEGNPLYPVPQIWDLNDFIDMYKKVSQ